MLRNSFKFLSLALAASLIVAPVSAIDWNSNSSRFGLGLAVVGIVYIVYKWCFSGENNQSASKEQNTEKMTPERLKKIGGQSYNIDPNELSKNSKFKKLAKANKEEK